MCLTSGKNALQLLVSLIKLMKNLLSMACRGKLLQLLQGLNKKMKVVFMVVVPATLHI